VNKAVGIIGYGNMGSAIAERIKKKYQVAVFDKDKNKTQKLFGVDVTDTILDLVNKSDVIILAVKPQDFDSVLNEIKGYLNGRLIISIAAGITTGHIEKILVAQRVVRVMPNMPVKIGKGMTCLCKGRFATAEDLNFTERLFKYVGQTIILNEDMMDAATAISGSGPGYYFDVIESNQDVYKNNRRRLLKEFIASLADAAENNGFSRKEGKLLAVTTGNASDYLLIETKKSPTELKKQIASKGGTTEAGLKVLKGRIANLRKAVKAAVKRAKELSRG